MSDFIDTVFGDVHSEVKVLAAHQLFEFGERLFTEVAELQQVGFSITHQIAECLHISGFEAVEGTHTEIHVHEFGLQQLTHMQGGLIEFFCNLFRLRLQRDFLVAEQHEMVDEDFRLANQTGDTKNLKQVERTMASLQSLMVLAELASEVEW